MRLSIPTIIIVAIGLQTAGVNVAGLAAAAAMVTFMFGALTMMVGATGAVQRLMGAWVFLLATAILLPMPANLLRGALSNRFILCGLASMVVISIMVGMLWLLARQTAIGNKQPARAPQRRVARRSQVQTGDLFEAEMRAPQGQRSSSDDFDLFGRGANR